MKLLRFILLFSFILYSDGMVRHAVRCSSESRCPSMGLKSEDTNDKYCTPRYCALRSWKIGDMSISVSPRDFSPPEPGSPSDLFAAAAARKSGVEQGLIWTTECESHDFCKENPSFKEVSSVPDDVYCANRYCALRSWTKA